MLLCNKHKSYMIARIVISIILSFSFMQAAFATHNRAGEITYRQISANTYEITIVTYTYTPSAANEYRGQLPIDWGDGTMSYVQRVEEIYLPDNYSKNTYVAQHTYPGPGVYKIVMEDPNRNLGIKNIFDSVNIPFSISTTLKIDPILGGNNTPILLNPPLDKAAKGQRFVHNPAAYDIDGDSLSYSLAVCRGENGEEIQGYSFPASSKEFRVDSINGDLIWDAPIEVGSYNVAMHIEEWRDGVKIGYVARDIQIEVYETNNNVPVFEPIQDICVRAGDSVAITITANDVDGNTIFLSARGGPLEETSVKATFASKMGVGTVSSDFVWVPSSHEVRTQPYTVVFKAVDSGADISLTALQYLNITVVGHPPQTVTAQAQASSVHVQWNNAEDVVTQFFLYRSRNPHAYTPEYCETDFPNVLTPQYDKIATLSSESLEFIDDDDGWGLTPGTTYCYRLVSDYAYNSPSYVSQEVCVEVTPTVSVLTNVSVEHTACDNGKMFVSWTMPFDIDTTVYKPPYRYSLLRTDGFSVLNFTEIAQFSNLTDTSFVDTSLCTQNMSYSYRVDLYSDADGKPLLIGSSPISSSPFVKIHSANKQIRLTLDSHVSWIHDTIFVYKQNETTLAFDSVGIFQNNEFVDTGLENLQDYCYYVVTSSHFQHAKMPQRVYNNSQILCSQPIDTIPPELIDFTVLQNCETYTHTIQWDECDSDIEKVRIYVKSCDDITDDVVLGTFDASKKQYIHQFTEFNSTMSACYYITTLDAAGNESNPSPDTCLYTCPVYVLPTIFTPNADGENELYKPAHNRYVQKIDLKIYSSWGDLVFETEDPEILWDGTHYTTHKKMPDGVFYYVCDVYEYWADCTLQPRTLAGFFHMFSDSGE